MMSDCFSLTYEECFNLSQTSWKFNTLSAAYFREGAAFSWGEPEQQSWDYIKSTVTQKLRDQSIQPTEYDLISDSEVF